MAIKSDKGPRVTELKSLTGETEWVIVYSLDNTTALKKQLLSSGDNNTYSFSLGLRVGIEQEQIKPLLTLKFRSPRAETLPSSVVLKVCNNEGDENNTSGINEPVYSLVNKDYVTSFQFLIKEEQLLDVLLGSAFLKATFKDELIEFLFNQESAVSLLVLKEHLIPNMLSEVQKAILLNEKQRIKEIERIKYDEAQQQRNKEIRESREREALRIKELEQKRHLEIEKQNKKETFLKQISKYLVCHLVGSKGQDCTDILLDISAEKSIKREFDPVNNTCILVDSTDPDIRVSSSEIEDYLINKHVIERDLFNPKAISLHSRFSLQDAIDVIDGRESYYLLSRKWEEQAKENKHTEDNRDVIKEVINKKPNSQGCYIATCVFGSYDCPEVWMLRRYRDSQLSKTWFGRFFIKCYYSISPTLVCWFGQSKWFKTLWHEPLDYLVNKLQKRGFEDTPYQDKY